MLHRRPEYQLDRLRMMMVVVDDTHIVRDHGGTKPQQGQQAPLLHLRWLRTMVVDLRRTPQEWPQENFDRLELQQRSAVGCAVERVVCKQLDEDGLSRLLPFLMECASPLTTLDLRGCWKSVDAFLGTVADSTAHCRSLRRLYLPPYCSVIQSTLDRLTQLEELDACLCENLTNVDFCSSTLRVLYASGCVNLTDAGLRRATRLEVLHVSDCRNVTNATPFEHRLLELDAKWNCGLHSAALSNCRSLQVLNASFNETITTLQPFALRLKEFCMNHDAASLNDAALVDATGLVKLKVADNRAITTVAPFGATLRELHVPQCTIGDAGLVTATNLVTLDASMNDKIRSLALCSSSLLELIATCQSVNDAALSTATNLMFLNVSCNERITTIEPCARSLRHLVAGGFNCTLTNQGVSSATQLVTLIREDNPNLTTIKPFQNTLEELTTDIDLPHCEVQTAPNLRDIEGRVLFLWKKAIPHLLQNGFYRPERLPEQRLFRNTVTYEYRQRDRQFRLVPHDYHHRYDEHQNSKESTLATQRCCLVS